MIQKELQSRVDVHRQKPIESHNNATNIVTPQFVIVDFTWVSKRIKATHKLSFLWSGPRRAVAVRSPTVCVIENLVTQRKKTCM